MIRFDDDDCRPFYSLHDCKLLERYIPFVLNTVFLVFFVFYFIYFNLSTKDSSLNRTAISNYLSGYIIFFVIRCTLQTLDRKITGLGTFTELLQYVSIQMLSIPFLSVSLQCARIMRLFDISYPKLISIGLYFFIILSYIDMGVMLFFAATTVKYEVYDLLQRIIYVFNFGSKFIFIGIASMTFILSDKTSKSTSKKFQRTIKILIFIACISLLISVLYHIYVDYFSILIIYTFDDQSLVSKWVKSSMFLQYLIDIIPLIATIYFMKLVSGISESDAEKEESSTEGVIMVGLI